MRYGWLLPRCSSCGSRAGFDWLCSGWPLSCCSSCGSRAGFDWLFALCASCGGRRGGGTGRSWLLSCCSTFSLFSLLLVVAPHWNRVAFEALLLAGRARVLSACSDSFLLLFSQGPSFHRAFGFCIGFAVVGLGSVVVFCQRAVVPRETVEERQAAFS